MSKLKNWPKRFFRTEIFSPGAAEARERAPDEAAFILKVLGLKRGQRLRGRKTFHQNVSSPRARGALNCAPRLLDLCCGAGRHSFEFARRGLQVTGADATAAYLAMAKRRARGAENPRFIRADMRKLPWRGEFDAAVNLWTSFGYFERIQDDLRTLKAVARALKPGGLLLIDVVNGAWLKKHGLARHWTRRADGSYLLEEILVRNGQDPSQLSVWTVLRPGKKPVRASFFLRRYDRARLCALLDRAGLKPRRVWGGYGGEPCTAQTPRLLVLARKPRR